ncbi:hypothetical protein [Fodinicola feengrottensis]|uniref:hypothetical protein n=1 Tax=Fodinicola feengrottensis TaxID=435914 RepID=UPI0024412D5E|nr:hypothetical protein [Fodinicola feengrottensis]
MGFAASGGLSSEVNLLSQGTGSLARGVPPVQPGTLFVLGVHGGMSVSPNSRFTLVFGRNEPEVHVCVGVDDPRVSRRQGHQLRRIPLGAGKPGPGADPTAGRAAAAQGPPGSAADRVHTAVCCLPGT